MAKVDLKGVYRVRSKGRVYFYAWKGRGAPRLLAPPGSLEFLRELADALAAKNTGDKTKIDGLVIAYRASDEFNCLADSTKRQWRPWLDRIQDRFGCLSIRQFDRPQIRMDIRRWRDSWKATPRTADFGLQVLSRLLSFAVAEGKLASNPCSGIPHLYRADRSQLIWTENDLIKLSKHASREIMWAARLAALTGLRRGDLLKLSWSHVGENFIEIRTGKSRGIRAAVVPVDARLAALLNELPRRATTVLTNTEGRPWASGFSSSWNKAVKAAEIPLHFHDLRGTAATRFYVAGLEIRAIAQILGWSEQRIERLIDRYVKRDEIILAQIRRLDENAARTKMEKPMEKPA